MAKYGEMLTLTFLAQIVGIGAVILSILWVTEYQGGFTWDNFQTVFNYHPVFMTIGFVFLYGNAAIIYRILPNIEKLYVKIAHGIIQLAAIVFAIFALYYCIESHRIGGFRNFYSLHSWVGILAATLFTINWISGFITFLYPKLNENIRAGLLPYHRFFGLAVFVFCSAACLMGILENTCFAVPNYGDFTSETVLVNFFGGSILVFATLIMYIATNPNYKKQNIVQVQNVELAEHKVKF